MLLLLFKDDDDDNGANDVNVNDGRIIIALLTIVCTQERRGICCRSILVCGYLCEEEFVIFCFVCFFDDDTMCSLYKMWVF